MEACWTFVERNAAPIRTFHPDEEPEEIGLFGFTMKTHYLIHMCLTGRYTNPLNGACYNGETLMGIGKRIVTSSIRGCKPLAAANKALYKYSRGMHIDLQLKENGSLW